MRYPSPNQNELLAKFTSTTQINKYTAGSCQNLQIQIPLDVKENGMKTRFNCCDSHQTLQTAKVNIPGFKGFEKGFDPLSSISFV